METSLSAKRVVVCDPDAVQVIREFLEPLGVTVEFAPEEDLVPADRRSTVGEATS